MMNQEVYNQKRILANKNCVYKKVKDVTYIKELIEQRAKSQVHIALEFGELQEQLQFVMDQVKNPEDWKNETQATIDIYDQFHLVNVAAALIYYLGGVDIYYDYTVNKFVLSSSYYDYIGA